MDHIRLSRFPFLDFCPRGNGLPSSVIPDVTHPSGNVVITFPFDSSNKRNTIADSESRQANTLGISWVNAHQAPKVWVGWVVLKCHQLTIAWRRLAIRWVAYNRRIHRPGI